MTTKKCGAACRGAADCNDHYCPGHPCNGGLSEQTEKLGDYMLVVAIAMAIAWLAVEYFT